MQLNVSFEKKERYTGIVNNIYLYIFLNKNKYIYFLYALSKFL